MGEETKKIEIINVPLNEIIPNREQPRIKFDGKALQQLADSIAEYGVLQPLVTRKTGNKYEIIAGERRYKASTLAGLEKVPVIVKELSDQESAEIALIENIQRQNLNPIEEALAYQRILDMGNTQTDLAQKMGKDQSTIANKIRLLNLDQKVKDAVINKKISESHARSLLSIEEKEGQVKLLDKIIDNRLTVRQTDQEVKEINEDKIEPKKEEIKEESAGIPDFNSLNNEKEELEDVIEPIEIAPVDNFLKGEIKEEPKEEKSIFFNDFDSEEKSDGEQPISSLEPEIIKKEEELEENSKIEEEPSLLNQAVEETKEEITTEEKPSLLNQAVEEAAPVIEEPKEEIKIEEQPSLLNQAVEEVDPLVEENKEEDIPSKAEETQSLLSSIEKEKEEEPKVEEPTDEDKAKLLADLALDVEEESNEEDSENYIDDIQKLMEKYSVNEETNNEPTIEAKKPEVKKQGMANNIKIGINTIRDSIKTLSTNGFSIDTEELDLEDEYQIIIKIKK